jgi:hypothetical protein
VLRHPPKTLARAVALPLAVALTLTALPPPAAYAADCLEGPRAIAGMAFSAVCAGGAEVLLDPDLDGDAAAVLRAQVAADVDAVQTEFGLAFESRPRIHVLGTTAAYASAQTALFGYPAATARWIAENSVSFFEPAARWIAVNWEAVRERRPIAAIRHELTHLLTLQACSPRCDLVPAWLNEGQARLAEAMTDGSAWRLLRVRYEAASLAATRTLLPLTALVTQNAWNAITGWQGYYKYQQAARVMELLRADIGASPIARLYAQIRAGRNVAQAYTALTGKGFVDFVGELPERMLESADAPGIATAPGTPEGRGTSFVLHGFAPESEVSLAIEGAFYDSTRSLAVSPEGSWFGWLDDWTPPGRYRVTAIAPGVCLSVVVAKAGGRRPDPDAAATSISLDLDPCAAPLRRGRPS